MAPIPSLTWLTVPRDPYTPVSPRNGVQLQELGKWLSFSDGNGPGPSPKARRPEGTFPGPSWPEILSRPAGWPITNFKVIICNVFQCFSLQFSFLFLYFKLKILDNVSYASNELENSSFSPLNGSGRLLFG